MQSVLAHYTIDLRSTIQPIGNGLIHTTYKVTTPNKEAYILQKINTTVFKNPHAIATNIKNISNYLKEQHPHYLFVQPIALANGNTMLELENAYYRVFPFVANSHSKDILTHPNQAYTAAAAFGKFTKLLSGFDCTQLQITIPDFHNLALRYQQLETALVHGNTSRIQECTTEIKFLQAHYFLVDTYQQLIANPDFKLRVTHHDTKISNVLFADNNKKPTLYNRLGQTLAEAEDIAICVIDLDTIMPGYFISDLGDMFRTYLCAYSEEETDFTKLEIRKDYYNAIVSGYLEYMQEELTATEKASIPYAGQFMLYIQALRFLTDYLNNDTYYGASYEKHNYSRAINQITLLKRYNAIV
jgi:Ser/Thr protein kinase RdoA (MazF antagonist)